MFHQKPEIKGKPYIRLFNNSWGIKTLLNSPSSIMAIMNNFVRPVQILQLIDSFVMPTGAREYIKIVIADLSSRLQ